MTPRSASITLSHGGTRVPFLRLAVGDGAPLRTTSRSAPPLPRGGPLARPRGAARLCSPRRRSENDPA